MLGGTNSLHANALDETLALPSEQAAEIALRTQQVLMEETGVANVADPLGGSWFIEQQTDRIEADAEKIFEQIKERGLRAHPDGQHPVGPITSGLLRGIQDGWFTGEIAESAFRYQQALEKDDKEGGRRQRPHRLRHRRPGDPAGQPRGRARAGAGPGRAQGRPRRRGRAGALDAMLAAARSGGNMIEPMLDAVRAEATLGEICGVLREEYGRGASPALGQGGLRSPGEACPAGLCVMRVRRDQWLSLGGDRR
ncbi:methylmalonyl-CoA mutase OS=Streptomyces tendae OX=1932 GN=GUR47_13815 PE=4 SV=1 [Streptomyces tendae]